MARRPAIEIARERAELAALRLRTFSQTKQLETAKRAYDAARPDQYHPRRGDAKSANAVMQHAGARLRETARYLDENSDIAIGVLDDLVSKIVGCGIGVEPQVVGRDGTLLEPLNDQIKTAWREWCDGPPEVKRDLPWAELQRQVCRAIYRDGEILVQHLEGNSTEARHRGLVPYSLAVLEADYLPFDDLTRPIKQAPRIIHGVEISTRGEALAYHLLPAHPGDFFYTPSFSPRDIVRIPADQITHLKHTRRFGQQRGVTIFHGVLNRLNQLLDWDDSELTGAKVASAFTVAITRSADFAGTVDVDTGKRTFELAPGMIFDNLLPGEGIETIGQNRPNAQYGPFRAEGLRAVAAGTGTSYSSISRRYEGSYSSQRQEMVESAIPYARLREYFVRMFLADVYRRFLDMAELAGVIDFTGAAPASRAAFSPIVPAMPWIDPLKEINADIAAIGAGIKSRHEVIRARGGDPREVDRQIETDTFTSADATPNPAEPPDPEIGDPENADAQQAAVAA